MLIYTISKCVPIFFLFHILTGFKKTMSMPQRKLKRIPEHKSTKLLYRQITAHMKTNQKHTHLFPHISSLLIKGFYYFFLSHHLGLFVGSVVAALVNNFFCAFYHCFCKKLLPDKRRQTSFYTVS